MSIDTLTHADWWSSFTADYRSGRDDAQHVTIMGPTGTGKSTLAMQIAERREYVAVLAAKPRDTHMSAMLRAGGYRNVSRLPEAGAGVRRVALWPRNDGLESQPMQRQVFGDALAHAFRVGVWHMVIDEGHYLADTLGLGDRIKTALQMGRSNGHGLILCAQRPAWLPRDVYSAADHLFLFRTNDAADLKAVSGLNGMNEKIVRAAISDLDPSTHSFLHIDTRRRTLSISALPPRRPRKTRPV